MKTLCISQRVTEKIQFVKVNKNGIELTVIDTPGFISTDDMVAIINDIKSKNIEHVIFGITIRIGRITAEETAVLYKILQNSEISKYLKHRTCFVFTNKDCFMDDSMMIEDEQLDKMFEDWLEKSPIIKTMIHLNSYSYCAITNRREGEERNKESNRIINKLMYHEYDNNKVCRIKDVPFDLRLDEVLPFTVREIRDLLTDVRNKEKFSISLEHNLRRPEEVTQMIFQTINKKGSSLTENDVKKIFGSDVSSCTIL
ncbi:unnamed protein product [Mytilus coruscus]|uniref:AIG1-type G domain-containing protein n=1 Tax=Mytilus coruscus TaxID=42192 RepID=A0A6J8CBR7_MYTCO|nr:unnamed protein product [Mytilus coruscus]